MDTRRSSGSFASDPTQKIQSFAACQGGHITRAQLIASGVSQRTIDRWVAGRRLIRVHRGVYALGHPQRNPVSAAHAVLLAGGPRCALAGDVALVLWDVWKRWPRRLEIVIAGDRRPRGLIVHTSLTLVPRDVRIVQQLRVTSPARTLLDMAPRLTPTRLTRAVNDLRLRGALTVDALADVLARNPRHRSVSLLRPHLELAQPEPTRSVLEDRFLPLLRRHGLPTPQINVRVGGHRVDAYFPDHNLIVELDGWGQHRTRHAFVEDRRRDAEILVSTGIPTVRLAYEDVADEIAGQLHALLRRARQQLRSGGSPHATPSLRPARRDPGA